MVGTDEKHEEVTSCDLASCMMDLEVQLAPELTKGSRSSDTRVITTGVVVEEFVAADIWPSRPRWGSWCFTNKQLPGLDYEVRSPKFKVQRPKGKKQ